MWALLMQLTLGAVSSLTTIPFWQHPLTYIWDHIWNLIFGICAWYYFSIVDEMELVIKDQNGKEYKYFSTRISWYGLVLLGILYVIGYINAKYYSGEYSEIYGLLLCSMFIFNPIYWLKKLWNMMCYCYGFIFGVMLNVNILSDYEKKKNSLFCTVIALEAAENISSDIMYSNQKSGVVFDNSKFIHDLKLDSSYRLRGREENLKHLEVAEDGYLTKKFWAIIFCLVFFIGSGIYDFVIYKIAMNKYLGNTTIYTLKEYENFDKRTLKWKYQGTVGEYSYYFAEENVSYDKEDNILMVPRRIRKNDIDYDYIFYYKYPEKQYFCMYAGKTDLKAESIENTGLTETMYYFFEKKLYLKGSVNCGFSLDEFVNNFKSNRRLYNVK